MKKVIHIITKLEFGGAQTSTLYTVKNLSKEKYRVYLFTSPGYLSNKAEEIDGISLKYFPFKREINPFYDFMTFILLLIEILKIHPDIVHTHSSKAGILGRWASFFCGVPHIYHTIHGFPFYENQFFPIKIFYVSLEMFTSFITEYLIAITNEDVKKGLRNGIGKRGKYLLIRDGIDISKFLSVNISKEEKKKKLGIKEKNVVGTISSLKKQKNPVGFVRMASSVKNKDTGFVIVGDGALRGKVEEEIEKRGLENRFYLLGWREDAEEILKTFDVFVLLSFWEGLPKALLESQTIGIPCVVTEIDGMKEIVKEGINGFLVKDYKEASYKVDILLKNQKLREEIGRKGSEKITPDFEISNMVKEIEMLYDK